MPVSSYVVRCALADQPALLARLQQLPGVEIGAATDQGFPVAAETATSAAAAAFGEELEVLPGVRSAVLVYHHFEDVAGTECGNGYAKLHETERGQTCPPPAVSPRTLN